MIALIAAAPVCAYAQVTHQFNLPAQSLANSLRAVGEAARVNVVFDPADVGSKIAPPLHGDLSAEEALKRLVQASGLRVTTTPSGSFVVVPTPIRSRAESERTPIRTATQAAQNWEIIGGGREKYNWEAQDAGRWFVSVTASLGGTGSRGSPFNSLRAAQQWSAPGDTIVILPAPANAPPLDGGIVLKPGQTLTGEGPAVIGLGAKDPAARVTNSSGFLNSGDAVTLADKVTVSNLVITKPFRAGVYGANVTAVTVTGNDISGHNQSCGTGIFIMLEQSLRSGTTAGGKAGGLSNGWAGIMIDSSAGHGDARIDGNYVHDATCGDGIDIRLRGTAKLDANITNNRIANLQEGTKQGLRSVLAIGMQSSALSELKAKIHHNSQTNIGSPGADSEAVFADVDDNAVADIDIDHNTADNIFGRSSANGMELVVMSRPARGGHGAIGRVRIANSSFTNITGDILEALSSGQDGLVSFVVDNVVARHSTNPSPTTSSTIDPGNGAHPVNRMSCLLVMNSTSPQFLEGGSNIASAVVRNSQFSDCDYGIVVATLRSQTSTRLEVSDSDVRRNRKANLLIYNAPPQGLVDGQGIPSLKRDAEGTFGRLEELDVRVRRTRLDGALEGPNVLVQAVPGTVLSGQIDLGSADRRLGAAGRNDLSNGKPAIRAVGIPVLAQGNWWGRAEGPIADDVDESNAVVDRADPLTSGSNLQTGGQ